MKKISPIPDALSLALLGIMLLVMFLVKAISIMPVSSVHLPAVSFTTQDRKAFSLSTCTKGYTIAAFFFTACPTMCPRMTQQMKRVQAVLKNSPNYLILFYSINPAADTPEKLFSYAQRNSIDTRKWLFLSGTQDDVSAISEFYLLRGGPDLNTPGTFLHDGQFLLTDMSTSVTTRYLGTDSASVDQLIAKIKTDL